MNTRIFFSCTLFLLLLVVGCYDPDEYTLTDAKMEEYLKIEIQDISLPADGFSRILITAVISRGADPDRRTVIFSTSDGTLIGGTKGTNGNEVIADGTGRAEIELQSAAVLGTARLNVRVKDITGLTRDTTIRFAQVNRDTILHFLSPTADTTAVADGATFTRFTVEVSPFIPKDQRKVIFTAVGATLAPNTSTTAEIPVDASNLASVDVRSPNRVGSGRLIAAIAGVTQEAAINFDQADPSTILVYADKFAIKSGPEHESMITAKLIRTAGIVSVGTPVEFIADTNGTRFGIFRAQLPTNDQGIATAIFSAGNTSYRGPVTIKARLLNNQVSGITSIEIVN